MVILKEESPRKLCAQKRERPLSASERLLLATASVLILRHADCVFTPLVWLTDLQRAGR